jgi:hypothetical protein
MFYPDDRATLHNYLTELLQHAKSTSSSCPMAIIVPHAGYIYSGPVAASAYHLLGPYKEQIKRVVLLGPAHRVPLYGLAASSADFFTTPLGNIPIDVASVNAALQLPQVKLMNEAHALEHSLEVQLPFLQSVLDDFTLIPLVVGEASAKEVSEVLELLWGGDETLIVISSDLSHYHDYHTAQKMDRATSNAIEQLRPEGLHYDDACGRHPVSGLLLQAKQKGLHATTVDLRNSGDTAGSRDQVVGYGAYIFEYQH